MKGATTLYGNLLKNITNHQILIEFYNTAIRYVKNNGKEQAFMKGMDRILEVNVEVLMGGASSPDQKIQKK